MWGKKAQEPPRACLFCVMGVHVPAYVMAYPSQGNVATPPTPLHFQTLQ